MYGSIRHEPLTLLEAAAENDHDCVDGSLRRAVANLSCLVLGACEEGSTEAARRLLAGVTMWPGMDVDMAVQGILEPEADGSSRVLPPLRLPGGWRLCSWMEALSLSDPVPTTPAPHAPASTPDTTAQHRAEQEQPRCPPQKKGRGKRKERKKVRRHPFRRRRLPQRADALSLLYIACAHGHTAVVHLLLDAGADPELRVVCQGATETAVYVASQRGHFTALDVLLTHGADPNRSRGDDDTSPLYTACLHGHIACVNLLLASGADAGTLARDGTSALHAAYTGGSLQCVEALLSTGIDLIRCDPMPHARPRWCRGDFDVASAGSSPSLHDAVKCGGARCLRELLVAGAMAANADIPVPKNDDDDLPLHLAVIYDEAECVQILLQHGADPNQHHGCDGVVPLGLACLHDHVECAELLLAANADPHMASSSTLEHAVWIRSHKNYAYFYGSLVWTPLLLASWHGHTDVMRLLLDPRHFDAATSTVLPHALRAASRCGHVDAVGLIVALEGGVGTDAKGMALCDAIDDGHVEVVRALLRHGADPNKLVSWRSTTWSGRDPEASQTMPLFLALARNHTLCAMALLEFGATANPPEGDCLSGPDRFCDGDASDQRKRDWVLSAVWQGQASFAVALLNAGALPMDLREALMHLITREQHYDSHIGHNLYLTLLQASLSTWRRQKWTDTMHELYDDPSVGVESIDGLLLPELKATWQRLHAIHTERPKLWSPSQHRQFPPGFQAAVELVMRVAEYSRRAVIVRGHNHGLAIAGALPPELWHRIVRMLSCSAWPLLAKTVGGPRTPGGKQSRKKNKGGKHGKASLEMLPSSAPFKAHVRDSESLDLERIFFAEGLLVTSISKMHSGDAGGFCFVEFATQADLRQALSLDGATLLHRSLANPLDGLDERGLLGEVAELGRLRAHMAAEDEDFLYDNSNFTVGHMAAEDDLEDYLHDNGNSTVDELRRMLKQTLAHTQTDWFGVPPGGRATLRINVAKPPTPKRVTRTTPSRSDSNWRAAMTQSSARSHNTNTTNAPVAQRTRPRLNILPRTLPLHRLRPQPQP